jgi:hypothetical protein
MCKQCGRCRNYLEVQTLTVGGGNFVITIAQQPLNDGEFYSVRLNMAFPVLAGTESVFVANGTANIQLVDWRSRAILSERMSRYGERVRMQYTKNGAAGNAIFRVVEGIAPIP